METKANRSLSIKIISFVLLISITGCLKGKNEKIKESPTILQEITDVAFTLLYPSKESGLLIPEKREIHQTGSKETDLRNFIVELFMGPKIKSAINPFPPLSNVDSIFLDKENHLYINLNQTFFLSCGSCEESERLFCLTNSILFNYKGIKSITILNEGRSVETLSGHLDISHPIRFNKSILSPEAEKILLSENKGL